MRIRALVIVYRLPWTWRACLSIPLAQSCLFSVG